MAVTQNTYTGNGSTTNYSLTFQYLEEDEIKVSLNGTLTTAYTLANATTISFTTAPANGVAIRIYRDTNVDSLQSTFFAGSAIRAQDLNDNFNQVLYSTQETVARRVDSTGGSMTGNLEFSAGKGIVFEGTTDDANETTLLGGDPTADRTLNLPNVSGTLVSTGDTGTVATAMIADSNVTTAKIADSNVTTAKIADANITTAKLADGSVTSAKIADGTIVADDIASSAVTTAKILDSNVTAAKIADSNVTTAKLADGAVTSAKIADGTIVAGDIASDAVVTSKILDQNVTTAKIADQNVTTAKIADLNVTTGKINDQAVTAAKIADGVIDSTKLTGATVVTNAEHTGSTPNDTSFFTTSASDSRYFRQDSSETITSGNPWSSSDTYVATTAAIDARVIDLVDDVGGFVPITNETSFPLTNPDINNPDGSGTIISIKEIVTTRTPASGTVTIANGAGSNTVTINGCGSTVLASGFGVLVETTSTLHTYNFHRLVPKATEVTTVAGISGDITTVATNNANVTAVAGNAANINTVAGNNANVTAVATNSTNINAVAGNATNINAVAGNAANINTVSTNIANVNNVGGSIANVNSVASNLGTVNDFAARYRVASSDPVTSLDTGDLVFNTTSSELRVYNGTAWQGGVTATGNLVSKSGDTMTGPLGVTAGTAALPSLFISGDPNTGIYSPGADQVAISTNGSGRLFINSSGLVGIGTSSPTHALTVEGGSSDISATFLANSNTTTGLNIRNTGSLATNQSTRIRLVNGPDYFGANSKAYQLINLNTSATDADFRIQYFNGTSFSDSLTIKNGGNVGIGTTNPQAQLHVSGGYTGFQYNSAGTTYPAYNTYFGAIGSNFSNGGSELDIWNTVGAGFAFRKQTAASTQSCLMYISSAGNVGIGTSSPSYLLDVNGIARISSYLITPQVDVATNTGIYSQSANTLQFQTNNFERARIDSSGRLLVGTSTARANLSPAGSTARFQVEGANNDTNKIAIISNFNSATATVPAGIYLSRAGSTDIGSTVIVASDNQLGQISFQGCDGTNFIPAARITSEVDGTPGANDMPGRLVFSTTADGASSPTERLRIDSSGRLGIGTSAPGSSLDVRFGTNPATDNGGGSNALRVWTSSALAVNTGGAISLGGIYNSSNNDAAAFAQIAGRKENATSGDLWGYLQFATNSGGGTMVERMRITGPGNVGIGTTPNTLLDVKAGTNQHLNIYNSGLFATGITVASANDAFSAFTPIEFRGSEFVWHNGTTQRAAIDSSGRLLVGTSSSRSVAGQNHLVQLESVNSSPFSGISIVNNANDGNGSYLILGKSRGTSTGSNTVVQNGDQIGGISFAAADGSNITGTAASITCNIDAAPGTGDVPGRLVFSTTADGASSPTERLRIANDGSISSVIPGGSTLYPRFGCRAWVNFNGTGTVAIRANGNVSSITDNGVGDYTVNFTTAMPDANYCAIATPSGHYGTNDGGQTGMNTTAAATEAAPATNATRFVFNNYSADNFDPKYVNFAVFR